MIEERHGLLEIPLYQAWPFLKTIFGCCLRKPKRKFKLGLKRAIRQRLDIRIPKSDLMIEDDPYLLLGYGMNSYFQIMVDLMIMCTLICVIAVPLMYVYASQGNNFTGLNVYSLGNLGGSSITCTQTPFGVPGVKMTLQCADTTSTAINTAAEGDKSGERIMRYGLIKKGAEFTNYCSESAVPAADSCSQYLNSQIETDLQACNGETSCTLKDFSRYIKNPRTTPAECQADMTTLFVQVACQVPDNQLATRQISGLTLACAAVFISLFSINYLDYVKKVQENNYIEWDVKTVTSGDYSIEFDITPEFFDAFKQQIY